MKKTINYLFVGFSALIALSLFQCSKSNNSLPPINGYNSSNDVGAANLLAHWTFDNTKNEVVSGIAPSKDTATSYTTGRIGQALAIDSGYLTYPALTTLGSANAMPSFSVSLWFKDITNNKKTYTSLFALTQSVANQTDWNAGPLNMGIETGWRLSTNDTLPLHPAFATFVNGTISHQDNIANGSYGDLGKKWVPVLNSGNPWIHYVCVYDQTASTFVIYANGVLVSNTNWQQRFSSPTPIIIAPPTLAVIGRIPNAKSGYTNSSAQVWQGKLKGTLDDIRVYGKALSLLEVGSLFQLGSAGR
ncbi:MAG: hypothetical protein JST69_13655 [Bacteroidetes bacterium]|nr:hypothetical protein [Bacteroidota bacterium]